MVGLGCVVIPFFSHSSLSGKKGAGKLTPLPTANAHVQPFAVGRGVSLPAPFFPPFPSHHVPYYNSPLLAVTTLVARSTNTSRGIAPRFSFVRRRTETDCSSISLSPSTSIYGTF